MPEKPDSNEPFEMAEIEAIDTSRDDRSIPVPTSVMVNEILVA